jgi:hypothetical protein
VRCVVSIESVAAVILIAARGAGAAVAQGPVASDSVPRAVIGIVRNEITLDGVLGEPEWKATQDIGVLRLVEPTTGEVPSGRTRAIVLASAQHLLIGIEAHDRESGESVAFSRDRDADLSGEDHVTLVFDTFLNGRTGYVFSINPLGARYDALITNAGEGERREWDAAWEAAVSRRPDGWSAEIRIPIESLSWREGSREWGFNLQRRSQRRLEVSRWSGVDRSVRLTQTIRAGRLTGLPLFTFGRGLTIRPALVGEHAARAGIPPRRTGTLSGDLTQRLGANSALAVTLNTDFAETEVDARRTNLTRFPLFFPEKRSFFLEASDIFDFAPAEGRQVDVLPFHSRRIGLLGGEEVPVEFGVRAAGRVSSSHVAVLGVQTGEAFDSLPRSQMGVGRFRHNVFGESTIGVIATIGDPAGRHGSWLTGADVALKTSSLLNRHKLLVGAWGLQTAREDLSGDRNAFGISVEYPTDPWHAQVTFKHIGSGFDPSLGFVPRRGVDIASLSTDYRWHSPTSGIRDMILQGQVRVVRDSTGRTESYSVFTAPLYLVFESGDRVEFNAMPTGERLSLPFVVAPGVQVAPGKYTWTRYRFEGTFASKRPVSGRATVWTGGFYGGRLTELNATILVKPSASAQVEFSALRNSGALSGSTFTQDLLAIRLRLNVSPDLTFNTYAQYDGTARLVSANTRLRWQFHPLGEAFLVYNRNHDRPDATWRFASDQLLVKVQYAFRM